METQYKVVKNEQGQYSIWLASRPLPLGWEAVDQQGSKAQCLAYIETEWTDIRPAALKEKLSILSNRS
ncbi:MbtH family protein [Pseudoalteromonas viridis]|uniref:MbtH family NRPS accessory protein n=1 Tax=Pseudoalteromonas viridis TaxID=339617 RepID=A0ABX7VB56_9GAMM|nr:MbtH family NRPS accessory protein [Pseudoalteromonas viridis]QTL36667.1 MbtH family NRPS accessory protein [Pseudoalteromonas viridis]